MTSEKKDSDRRVLIVDDDHDVAESLAGVLKLQGYTTSLAHSEEGALTAIKQFDAQVALLDIRLGSANGIDLISQVKKIRPGILCVMITGFGSIDTAIRALKEGAYDYLRKPTNPSELFATLDRCFEKITLEREKAAAEEEIKVQAQQLRASFNQAAIGMAHLDLEGRWILLNQKLCDIVGYTKEELLQKTFYEIIHPDDILESRVNVKWLLAGEIDHFIQEKRYLRKDGSEVWVNLTLSLVRGADGQPKNFVAIIEDINERKLAEENLRKAHAKLELMSFDGQSRNLKKLILGNERYTTGKCIHPHQTLERRREIAKIQNPFATVIACADSRVSPEIIFDQGLGDLFVLKVAGNVLNDMILGSLEYSVQFLSVELIVVLGHKRCGAVNAALSGNSPEGHIGSLVEALAPAIEKAKDRPGDVADNVARENVRGVVKQLKESMPILNERVNQEKLQIVGAFYDLDTGTLEILDEGA
ncbi:MAG: carbonic anhydrase [Nitrospinales bacterium]